MFAATLRRPLGRLTLPATVRCKPAIVPAIACRVMPASRRPLSTHDPVKSEQPSAEAKSSDSKLCKSSDSKLCTPAELNRIKADAVSSYRSLAEAKSSDTKGHSAPKTTDVVRQDLGLARYLRRILGASTVGICGGLATAQALAQVSGVLSNPLYCMGGGFALSIAGIMGIGVWQCKRVQTIELDPRNRESYTAYSTSNPVPRILSFAAISAGMGGIMAPLTVIVNHVDPILFPMATFLSVATMGGCLAYAMHQPNASLIRYRGPLVGALTGFVGLGLVSLASSLLMGPNMFALAWTNIDLYGGILLFCGLTGYDVHHAIERYQQHDADHLGHAASFYLDFCNFFVRFLSILLKARLDRRD